jgi:hypothetical protein
MASITVQEASQVSNFVGDLPPASALSPEYLEDMLNELKTFGADPDAVLLHTRDYVDLLEELSVTLVQDRALLDQGIMAEWSGITVLLAPAEEYLGQPRMVDTRRGVGVQGCVQRW